MVDAFSKMLEEYSILLQQNMYSFFIKYVCTASKAVYGNENIFFFLSFLIAIVALAPNALNVVLTTDRTRGFSYKPFQDAILVEGMVAVYIRRPRNLVSNPEL